MGVDRLPFSSLFASALRRATNLGGRRLLAALVLLPFLKGSLPPGRQKPCSPIADGESGPLGAPGKIRTCDLWLRRPTLYPAELRAPSKVGVAP